VPYEDSVTDDRIEADADVAARYLLALLQRGVPNTDAVALTGSYMSSRAIVQGRQLPDRPPRRGLSS
jgi:hypothetical protein